MWSFFRPGLTLFLHLLRTVFEVHLIKVSLILFFSDTQIRMHRPTLSPFCLLAIAAQGKRSCQVWSLSIYVNIVLMHHSFKYVWLFPKHSLAWGQEENKGTYPTEHAKHSHTPMSVWDLLEHFSSFSLVQYGVVKFITVHFHLYFFLGANSVESSSCIACLSSANV